VGREIAVNNKPWLIEIIPLPTKPGEAPAERRIAQLLKLALRAFRLRCVCLAVERPAQPLSGDEPTIGASEGSTRETNGRGHRDDGTFQGSSFENEKKGRLHRGPASYPTKFVSFNQYAQHPRQGVGVT
jgi:hypothetical protein